MSDDLELNYYLVCFVDLLGHQEVLKSFPNSLHELTVKEAKEFEKIIQKAFGSIKKFQMEFEMYIDNANANATDPSLKEVLERPEIKYQRFSDGLVIYISLKTKNIKALPLKSVLPVLVGCGGIFILNLAMGEPIRGGIDVGLGAELNEGEIYGPVVAKAYNLESKVAQYPRVVIGDEFVSYLRSHAVINEGETDPDEIIRSKLASKCMKLIAVDDDGYPFIDYLGKGFKEHLLPKYDEFVKKAYNFVIKQSEKYKTEKNSKLAFRYSLLRSYFDARL